MQVTEGEDYYAQKDPVVNAFRTFSRLNDVAVSGKVAVVPTSSYAEVVMNQAADISSDFVLIPWSEYGSVTDDQSVPFTISANERYQSKTHLDFINQTLAKAVCNTGIFVNKGFGGLEAGGRPQLARSISAMSMRSHRDKAAMPIKNKSHQIFLPFFGGVDDRVALRLVLQLAKNPNVSVTVAHFSLPTDDGYEIAVAQRAVTTGGSRDEHAKSEAADKTLVVEEVSASDLALLSSLQSSLPQELVGRVTFMEIPVTSSTAVPQVLSKAKECVGNSPSNAGDIIVVGRKHLRLGDGTIEVGGSPLKNTVGAVADQAIMSGVKASVLVVQAAGRGLES